MARILSTETSSYINRQVEIYGSNKIGQFSKFLDKNPIFVTYYHINTTRSRADAGLQTVKEEIAPNSPLRYNKIKEFPIYGLSDLKPDLQYDETGADIEMDLSGLIILPKTVRPIPGDHFYVKFPNTVVGLLFRVTSKQYNTIQSNDFYQIDAEIRAVAKEMQKNTTYKQLEKQVVEEYTCIFDNIGTEDSCIISDDALGKTSKLGDYIKALLDGYYDTFYQADCGSFAALGMWNNTPTYFYDLNVIHFMKNTGMWNNEDIYDRVVALTYDDILPPNFANMYRKLLWYAVEKRDLTFLARYSYYEAYGIVKDTSPFVYYHPDFYAETPRVFTQACPISDAASRRITGVTREYWPSDLTNALLDESGLCIKDPKNQLIYDYLTATDKLTINLDDLATMEFRMTIDDYLYGPVLIYILLQAYNGSMGSGSGLEIELVGEDVENPEVTEEQDMDQQLSKYVSETLIPKVRDVARKIADMEERSTQAVTQATVKEGCDLCVFTQNATIQTITITPRNELQASGWTLLYNGEILLHDECEFKKDETIRIHPNLAIKYLPDIALRFEFDDYPQYSDGEATVIIEYLYDDDVGKYARDLLEESLVNP